MSKTVADVMYVSPQTAAERGNGDRGSGSHFRSTLPLARMESADSRDRRGCRSFTWLALL